MNPSVEPLLSPELPEKSRGLRAFLQKIQNRIAASPSSYLAFCFIFPTVLMYLMYVAMEIYPFGNTSVLVLDLHGQYVFFHEALRNAVYGEGNFLYSFFRALGGEFMGIYVYYLASPLSYLVVLFPQSWMQEAILTIILLKVGLCGFTFGYYLHKHTEHPNRMAVIAFSILYALTSYVVVYQSNLMWLDALIWLPILTYSIERLVKHRRYKLFVVSLAMTVMSNYYLGYMTCIFVALYFFYYYFSQSPEELNPHRKKLYFLRSLGRITLFAAIAIAISAFVILSAYYSLSFGKSDFSSPNAASWSLTTKFQLLDFFTKFLPGSYDTVTPSGLPLVYCGILTLFLVPVYFMSRRFSSREKLLSLSLIVIFVLSFIVSPLDLIWHGFQKPNWLNYRYSYMLCFFLLILAYKGLGNLRKVGERFLLGVCAFLILFVTVCDKLEFETYLETEKSLLELETVWLTVFVSIALTVVLCLLIRHRKPKAQENISALLVAVICIEIFCNGLTQMVWFDHDVLYGQHSGEKGYRDYLENLRPIVEVVKEEDQGFYRMEKVIHRKYNDNMALGMRGLSGSTSTLNAETIKLLSRMGYTSRSHLSQYRGGTPVNDSIFGIKYILDASDSDRLANTYEAIASDEHYTAYQNPYALSLAYGVDSSLADFVWNDNEIHFERLNQLVGAMLGNASEGRVFQPIRDLDLTVSEYCAMRETALTTTFSAATSDREAYFTYSFVATENAEYYFYTPSTSPRATELFLKESGVEYKGSEKLLGKSLGEYLGNNTRGICSLGYFEKGQTVEVTVKLKDDPLKIQNNEYYVWYLDEEAFENAFGKLGSNPQLEIHEGFTEDHLTGTISTERDGQMILTTIPYDEGWKLYVDGEPITYYKSLDALIAFDLETAGEHTVELKYSPGIYRLGLTVSGIGLAVFVLLCLSDFVIKKRRNEESALPSDDWILEDFQENYEESIDDPPTPTTVNWKAILSFFAKKKPTVEEPSREEEETTDEKGEL